MQSGKIEVTANEGLMVILHDGEEVFCESANRVDNIEEAIIKAYELGLKDGSRLDK